MARFAPPLALVLALGLVGTAVGSPISNARQLVFEGNRSGEGYFGPEGRLMIFQSERAEDNPFFQIYTLDFETGDVTRLSPGIGKTTCGWIHPDGDRALFASTQFDPEARAKMQAEVEFRASGRTRRYAWDYDPTYDIVEVPLGGGDYTRLAPAEGYDAEGSYSPDGSTILFASNRHAYGPDADLSEAEAARLDRDPSYFLDLYAMDADGTNLRRLTDTPGYDGGPFYSADGTKITWRRFSPDGARAEIFVANADGSDARAITDLGVLSWAPFFHPSGAYLIFSTNLLGFSNFELYLVDPKGRKEPVRVTEREGFDGLATFSPDGATLSWTSNDTPSGNSQIFVADWDHEAALALLDGADDREAAATPVDATEPAIAVADLEIHVEALTDERMAGRLTGTEGERLATAYVADAFEALGLDPAGDGGTFFEAFEFTSGVSLGEGNAMTVSIDSEARNLAVEEVWTPYGFSATGEVEPATVAFAGHGLVAPAEGGAEAVDAYGDLDVADKWVLLWRGLPDALSREERTRLSRFADPRYKASVARSRGARGVIFAPAPDAEETALPRLALSRASGRAGLPVVAVTAEVAGRMLSVLGDDLDAMRATIAGGGAASTNLIGVEAGVTIALDVERGAGRNVLGRLDLDGEAAEAGRPPLVIGAHVDHLGFGAVGSLARAEERERLHPGADDNASGVAALIEIAQKLAADRDAGRLEGVRDVVFAAWSGEELGLLGASHHVEARAEAAGADDLADLVSAYINMDMVGRLDEHLILHGLGSSEIWAREIERRNAVIGLPIRTSQDTYLPTDATAFYLAGVPILSVFTGTHEDYHRPSDTADTLNYEGLEDIARFVALIVRSRASDPQEPGYIERERPQDEGGRRMSGVFLGTIPDYAEEGQTGVPLSGVVKGGPAEEAGVRGGDVMVGLAGEDLADIYDFVRTLNGLKPGETYAVTVLREGERVELQVTPRTREASR